MELECTISKSQEEILSRIVGFYEECEVHDDPGKHLECTPSSRHEDVGFGDEELGTTCDTNEILVSFGDEDDARESEPTPVFITQTSPSPAKKKKKKKRKSQDSTNSFDGAFESDRSKSPSPLVCFNPNVGFPESQGCDTGAGAKRRSLGVDDKIEAGTVREGSEQFARENGLAREDDQCIRQDSNGRSQADKENIRMEKQNRSEESKNDTNSDAQRRAEVAEIVTREKELGRCAEESIQLDNSSLNGELVPGSVKHSNLEEADQEREERQEEVDIDQRKHEDDKRKQEERETTCHQEQRDPEKDVDRKPSEPEQEVDRGEQEHANEVEKEREHEIAHVLVKEKNPTERQQEQAELENGENTENREDEMDSECLEFTESHLMFQTQLPDDLASPNATFQASFGCTSMSPRKENCIVITPLGDRIAHSHSSLCDDGSTSQLKDDDCGTPPLIAQGTDPPASASVTRRPKRNTPVQGEAQVLSLSTSKRSEVNATSRVSKNLASALKASASKVPQAAAAEQNIRCELELTPKLIALESTKTSTTTGAFETRTLDEAKLSAPRSVHAKDIVSVLLSAGKRSRFKDLEGHSDSAKRVKVNQNRRSADVETNIKEQRNVATAEEIISSYMTPVNKAKDFGVAEFSAALTKFGYKLPPFTR